MPFGRPQQITHCSTAIYCSTNWNKWDPMLHLNAFLQHFSCCILTAFQLLHACEQFNSSECPQYSFQQVEANICLILDGAPRMSLILVPLWASWSYSSCGRCQFEGIWQVALSDSGVTYGFQMRLGHPSAMPIRQSCPLHPVWEEERIQHKATECLLP